MLRRALFACSVMGRSVLEGAFDLYDIDTVTEAVRWGGTHTGERMGWRVWVHRTDGQMPAGGAVQLRPQRASEGGLGMSGSGSGLCCACSLAGVTLFTLNPVVELIVHLCTWEPKNDCLWCTQSPDKRVFGEDMGISEDMGTTHIPLLRIVSASRAAFRHVRHAPDRSQGRGL